MGRYCAPVDSILSLKRWPVYQRTSCPRSTSLRATGITGLIWLTKGMEPISMRAMMRLSPYMSFLYVYWVSIWIGCSYKRSAAANYECYLQRVIHGKTGEGQSAMCRAPVGLMAYLVVCGRKRKAHQSGLSVTYPGGS